MTPLTEGLMNDADRTIDRLIRARCTCIAIGSTDEVRVLRNLVRIGQRQPHAKAVVAWASTTGFQTVNADGTLAGGAQPDVPANPFHALGEVISRQDNESRAIYVFRDMHDYFWNDPVIRRKIRDLAQTLIAGRKAIVLLSPQPRLPADLQEDVVLIRYPLPDVRELRMVVDEAIRSDAATSGAIRVQIHEDNDANLLAEALQGLTESRARLVFRVAIARTGEISTALIPVISQMSADQPFV